MTAVVRLRAFDTGFCVARSSLVASGTGWHEVQCHAPAFLLEHPRHAPILFDTGYAPRIVREFTRGPARVYGVATPTTVGTPLVAHLEHIGIRPRDIEAVIVSHLHADHVAGLHDFTASRFVVSQAALALLQRARGIDAVRRGILPALFPEDFGIRAQPLPGFSGPLLPGLGGTHDLLGDGSVLLVELPGHARGQVGALVRTASGDVLLCADGAWTTRAWRERRPPHWITRVMQDDMPALLATLDALRAFADAHPSCTILPTHCPETLRWMATP